MHHLIMCLVNLVSLLLGKNVHLKFLLCTHALCCYISVRALPDFRDMSIYNTRTNGMKFFHMLVQTPICVSKLSRTHLYHAQSENLTKVWVFKKERQLARRLGWYSATFKQHDDSLEREDGVDTSECFSSRCKPRTSQFYILRSFNFKSRRC